MTVEAFLEPETLSVESGASARCEVRVRNNGNAPRELGFRILGEASAWTTVFPRTVSLPPGGEGVARLLASPPRGPRPLAGPVPLTVEVSWRGADVQTTVAEGTLEVAPMVQLSAVLMPPRGASGEPSRHLLVVENRGNTVLRASVRSGGANGPVLDIDPSRLTVAPGESADAGVTVRAPKTVLTGRGSEEVFQVLVEPDGGSVVTVEGRLHRESIVPGWLPKAAAGVLALALTGGLLRGTVLSPSSDDTGGAAPGRAELSGAAPTDPRCVTLGHEDEVGNSVHEEPRPERLLPYEYSFMRVSGCTPVRFNPCEPIHFVINPAKAPPGGPGDVQAAMAELARATGMTFVYDGTTDETMPGNTRLSYQPQRYGNRWAPILIAWESKGGGGEDQTVGRGGATDFDFRNGVILTGYVGLNVDAIVNPVKRSPLQDGFGTASGSGPIGPEGVTWGRVLLHELAHLVGLGHAGNHATLMYPQSAAQTTRPAKFNAGDLPGLRLLGREAGCLPTPQPGVGTPGPAGPVNPTPSPPAPAPPTPNHHS